MRAWFTVIALVSLSSACGGDGVDGAASDLGDGDAAPTVDAGEPLDGATADAASPIGCDPPGTGQVDGSVTGLAIAPVVRVEYLRFPHASRVLLDEAPGECGLEGASGERLLLGWVPGPPEVGEVPVGSSFPDPVVLGELAAAGGAGSQAIDGTVAVTSVGEACVVGSFSLEFLDGETLSGGFAARVCP